MSHVSTKGWYIQKLKEAGIHKWEGYHLSYYKGSYLAWLWRTQVQNSN